MLIRVSPTSSLEEVLDALSEMGPEGGLDRFAASLNPDWIDEALRASGAASIRRRKLPADQALWLVLGICLFADRAIVDVVDHLDLVLPGVSHLARSTVSKARYRLGQQPLRWLFDKVATTWADTLGLGGYRGLSLYAIDGSHLRVDDSDENFAHFGKPGGRNGKGDAGYPQLRLVALMNLSNRLLRDAEAGPWSRSEMDLAHHLIEQISDHSLTILDRYFVSYELMCALYNPECGRHFMIRGKKNLKYEITAELGDGSALARIRPTRALHKQRPDLPAFLVVRVVKYQHPGGEPGTLLTTLLDPATYPAHELIALYHDRWEMEVGFDELKTHMLERKECLRSKKPEGVYQELWGQLLVYNLVRREMLMAAQAHDLPARRISFRSSLLWIRNVWITAAMTRSPANLPKRLAELRSTLDVLILPERRSDRRYPRHVKIKMSSYARNRGHRRGDGQSPPTQSTTSQPNITAPTLSEGA